MELKESHAQSIHTCLKIYPSKQFTAFLNTLPDEEDIPDNIIKLIGRDRNGKMKKENAKSNIDLNDGEVRNMKKIKKIIKDNNRSNNTEGSEDNYCDDNDKLIKKEYKPKENTCPDKDECIKRADKVSPDKNIIDSKEEKAQIYSKPFISTTDIDWVYCYLQIKKSEGTYVPYLHALLEGSDIKMPENEITERNPDLEAKCLELRARQEGKEYTRMSLKITVDDLSVKMKRLEDISYQKHKQLHAPFAFGNWNKFIHKRSKVGKNKKEHQD